MVVKGPVPAVLAPTVEVEGRLVVALLRPLTKLLRPEGVGIAALAAAREIGRPRAKAQALAGRLMCEAHVPRKGWRPWPGGIPRKRRSEG